MNDHIQSHKSDTDQILDGTQGLQIQRPCFEFLCFTLSGCLLLSICCWLPATQWVTTSQLEFMLSHGEQILPIIFNNTGGGEEGGINEKSGLQDFSKTNRIVLNMGISYIHLKSAQKQSKAVTWIWLTNCYLRSMKDLLNSDLKCFVITI